MAKVTDNDRIQYNEKVKVYTDKTKEILNAEKDRLVEIKKTPDEASMKKLGLVDDMLNLASNYIAVNGVSQVVLKNKNEEALNDARKSLYKAVIYLEEIVTNLVDAPFSDYDEKLATISDFDANQRYQLVSKLGFAIDLLVQAYGDNSKWRWSFVELEGRYAAVAKNIMDLRNVIVNKSPESPYYDSTVYHLRLIKELLSRSASRYRDKYELNTGAIPDFKTGISFLGALRRIHIILAESEEAESIKKKLAIWKTKLESDQKKQEEAKKKLG
jgi:hypothetical protein